MFNAIHVTHEAVHKVGGIGTVLEGLINSRPYRDGVARTVLVSPLFYPDNPERLGPGGLVEYSSLDNFYDGPYANAFRHIESEFNVRIVYGRRPVEDAASGRRTLCEALQIDLRGINAHKVNELKGILWQHFGIQSDRYQHVWEFEQYVQLAAPAIAALQVLQLAEHRAPAVVFAHEFMGVPTTLALQACCPQQYRTLFYAHEVAPIRRLIEARPGHDVTFYNALHAGRQSQLTIDQVFGPQQDYHKYALVSATHHCDTLLAVGHHIQQELLFLHTDFEQAEITLSYNGVPAMKASLDQRRRSRKSVDQYLENLLGWCPDWLFTHVTRLAPSKALWRDLDVLEALEPGLRERGQSAVMLVMSTELPRRPMGDILHMERSWDWPLAHREGGPDLTANETAYYRRVQAFNARSRNVKLIYINQFGFDRARCGLRVPEELEMVDIRRATDVEFGLSVYEPFGISPLEPLTYGALCAVSTSCGCAGFIKQASGSRRVQNVILANFIDDVRRPRTVKDALAIDAADRREIEVKVAQQIAEQIIKRLPADDAEREKLMRSGYELAKRMSWDVVAERFVFPAIQRALARRRVLTVVA